jgi:ABC-type lipoprotein export system ATPase subunit
MNYFALLASSVWALLRNKIILVTHEHDIAQFAKRVIVFRDGKIRKDDAVRDRPLAYAVLQTMPTLDD